MINAMDNREVYKERKRFADMLRDVIREEKVSISVMANIFGVSNATICHWKGTNQYKWCSIENFPSRWQVLESFLEERSLQTTVNGNGLIVKAKNDFSDEINNVTVYLVGEKDKITKLREVQEKLVEEYQNKLKELIDRENKLQQAIDVLRESK